MATQEVYYLIFGAVVLVIVFVAFFLFAIKRLRARKAQLLRELQNPTRHTSDRAFNRLEMARREVEILARQGTDVSPARSIIARSQAAFDLRQFDKSYELAQSAHESLVAARQGNPLSAAAPPLVEPASPRRSSRAVPVPTGPMRVAAMASSDASGPPPASSGLPRNRVESQFEMRLLDSDLESARQSRPDAPATLAAVDLQEKARAAFALGQYTDAFRLALKGRRGLGGQVEAVAAGPTPPPGMGADTGAGPVDPMRSAEQAASAVRCPNCGYPTGADDVFCRGCGASRSPATCPRCGTPRVPSDTFCGRCGERFS
ncbi:MAG: zinc ribbon domain-containing protein [Thermoplasmata archaeon]